MLGLLHLISSGTGAFFSGSYLACNLFKEKQQKPIPAEYWNNKDLMYKDKMNPDISPEQVMKNLEKGKYYSPTVIPEKYEVPSIKIVDRVRYEKDVREYGKEIADDNAKMGLYSFVLKS
jgi:hypothetical protein